MAAFGTKNVHNTFPFSKKNLANSSDAAQLLLELMSGALDVTQNYLESAL